LEEERMERAGCDPEEVAAALRDIAAVNRRLGGARALLRALDPHVVAAPPDGDVEILDVGTGGADLAVAMEAFGLRRGRTVRVTAVDRDPAAIRVAARAAAATRHVRVVLADARALPFEAKSFDVVCASMFLHHFGNEDAATLLGSLLRLARRAVIVNDLERGVLPWLFIALAARVTRRSPLFVHDAPLSVRRGFTPGELLAIGRRAGGEGAWVERLWPFRLALTLPTSGGGP
jgi:2-polyprenyl-3-methyl-5-hydroxy-6-metoxy-1,4-benzoquinol methylase